MPGTLVPRRVAPPSFWLGNDLYLAVQSKLRDQPFGGRAADSTHRPIRPTKTGSAEAKLDAGWAGGALLGLRSPTSVASKRNGPDLKKVGATAPRWLVIIGGTGSGHPAAR
jgi:hypothetical protein